VEISVGYRNKPDVLSGVSFQIERGEIFGLVGASGSGKSTVALAILRLLENRGGTVRGSIRFEACDLMRQRPAELRRLRGQRIALVQQSPMSALNPALSLDTHFREAWRAHSRTPWRAERPRVIELLRRMELPADEAFLRRYSHQISVGQAQRVLLAMALLHKPSLLIADEPTSALHPHSQREIVELLGRLNRECGMAILYISHDLQSVGALCRRVGVLRGGRLAASGPTPSILKDTLQFQ
jgi:ABC-type glutathione transport system ATPase component